jgi:glycerophosphoryl diester phosphodiesterase
VGMKPHPDFPRQQKLAIHKPLLGDVLDAAEKVAKERRRPVYYNIEIKSKPENDGKKHPPIEEFVDLAMAVISTRKLESRVTIQSFDPRALQVMRRKYPSIATSLLMEGTDKRTLDQQLQELGFTPTTYSPHFSLITEQLVQQCREKRIKLVPWTVNSLADMQRLKQLGVDGIISDYPDLFSQLQ